MPEEQPGPLTASGILKSRAAATDRVPEGNLTFPWRFSQTSETSHQASPELCAVVRKLRMRASWALGLMALLTWVTCFFTISCVMLNSNHLHKPHSPLADRAESGRCGWGQRQHAAQAVRWMQNKEHLQEERPRWWGLEANQMHSTSHYAEGRRKGGREGGLRGQDSCLKSVKDSYEKDIKLILQRTDVGLRVYIYVYMEKHFNCKASCPVMRGCYEVMSLRTWASSYEGHVKSSNSSPLFSVCGVTQLPSPHWGPCSLAVFPLSLITQPLSPSYLSKQRPVSVWSRDMKESIPLVEGWHIWMLKDFVTLRICALWIFNRVWFLWKHKWAPSLGDYHLQAITYSARLFCWGTS